MKTKSTLQQLITLCVCVFASLVMTAQTGNQDYKKLAAQEGSNYFEIVNQKRTEFNTLKSEGELTREENKDFKHFERWAYFWRDRVDANGNFPSALEGWKNAGLLDEKLLVNNQSSTKNSSSAEAWTNIGAQTNPVPNGYPNPPQLGRLNAFWRYVDAGNAANNVLLVGAPTGGIWKSTDNGATWSPKFDTFAGIGITDIKGSSSVTGTPGVLYATTGDYDGTEVLNSIGLYKSTDMGETWTATGLSFALSGAQLLGHLVVYDDNTVVVGTANSIKRTTDGGANWTDVHMAVFGSQNFGRMASFGANIVATDAWEGIHFSTDSGVSWTTLQAPNNNGKMAVTADDSGTFFIQDQTGQIKQLSLAGSGSATNFGVIPAAYSAQGGYNQVLVKRGSLIIDGSVNGNSSSDNGATWYQSLNGYWTNSADAGVYMHSDHHQAGYLDAGLSFWNVNDGGLDFITYTSPTDQLPTVEYKSNGVVTTQIYTISINPSSGTNDDFMMANQDNDGFSKESGQWVSVLAGDGVCSAIDYGTPGIRYLGGTTGSLRRSDNSGWTGNYFGTSIPKPGNAEFVWPFSLHTTTSTTAYGGFDDMYVSTNISTTVSSDPSAIWTDLNAGAGNPITFDNQGSNIAVVGTTGLRRSSDGGTTWSSINQPSGQDVNSFSIDASSTSGNTIYATVKEYNAGQKVFKSTDGGSTWSNISGNLPNILMKKVVLKQNQTGEYLFVATELGVYYISPSVTTWTKLGTNLPNVIVNDIKINYMNDKMYIGTYGRGMWEISIANSTLGVEEVSFETEFKVFPNPVTYNELNVHLSSNEGVVDYIIYNIVGGVIQRGTFINLKNTLQLNSPASGMYMIKMNAGGKTITKKFIVK